MFYEEPIFFEKNRVHREYTGGQLLGRFTGDGSGDGRLPEEWIASTVEAINPDIAIVREGISKIEGAELFLDEAIRRYPRQILGDKEELGILVKYLDSAIRLPVQAHPDRRFSEQYFHSSHGKEESWVVLATRPGACIYFGFREGVTPEEFRRAADACEDKRDALEGLLVRHEVAAGDVVFIPAKMVHAIGAGCLILEVQEPTDFTITPERWCGDCRLTDEKMYLGLDREVALDCFRFDLDCPAKLIPKSMSDGGDGVVYESLIGEAQTKNFHVNRITLENGAFLLQRGAAVYCVIEGEGELKSTAAITGKADADYSRRLRRGDYFLLPHDAVGRFRLTGQGIQVVECYA